MVVVAPRARNMSEMAKTVAEGLDIRDTDVLFACPYCEKSLVIDQRAAGLMVTCPDCKEEVIVPPDSEFPPNHGGIQLTPDQRIESLTHALQASHEDIRRLSTHLQEVGKRRKVLEHLRAQNIRRMEHVAEELTVIQGAIDRVAAILQDSVADE